MSDYKDPHTYGPVLATWGLPHVVADGGIDPEILDDRITFRRPLPDTLKTAWCAAANGVNTGWSLVKFDTPLAGRIIAQVFEAWAPLTTLRTESLKAGHFGKPPSQFNGSKE